MNSTKVYISKSKSDISLYLSSLISPAQTICLSGGSLTSLIQLDSSCGDKTFFFSDERLVPLDHKQSNYYGYSAMFTAAGITKIHKINQNLLLNPTELVQDYLQNLKSLLPSLSLDLLLLGMGPDGHTASLFPSDRKSLEESEKLVEYIHDSPKPPSERITLTFPVLNRAKMTVFVVLGSEKAKVVHEILDKGIEYPAGMVKGNIVWVLDKDSAGMLERDVEELPLNVTVN